MPSEMSGTLDTTQSPDAKIQVLKEIKPIVIKEPKHFKIKPNKAQREMKKKLALQAKQKKEENAISKIQSLVRSFLFVRRLKYAFYRNELKRDAARRIIKIYRYLIERSLDRETKRKAAILIQRYLKGKIGKEAFLTIQMIQKKLEMDKVLGDMREKQMEAMKLYVAKWAQGRWRIYKA